MSCDLGLAVPLSIIAMLIVFSLFVKERERQTFLETSHSNAADTFACF